MSKNTTSLPRKYDIDWIRVVATIAVFFYHCSMFFNPFPWHIKNNELDSNLVLIFSLFVGAWIMPIFFVMSGVSMTYSLGKRDFLEFFKERALRLGVPLVFGVFILTPPQIYIERLGNSQFSGSFFQFFPHFFDGVYLEFGGEGNFAFFGLHLWYLLVLMVFSLLTYPLFKKVPITNKFGIVHFIFLPLFLFLIGLIQTQGLGGWDLVFYLVVLIYGYYFFSNTEFKPAVKRTIKFHFFIAATTSIAYVVWFMKGFPMPGSVEGIIFYGVRTINCWSWLLCIIFLADKYLNNSNSFLKYGSEASMPFYVLHQPVIVIIGFLIRDLAWPLPLKGLFLIVSSFVIIMISYHFIIKRINVLRFLFGMKTINEPNNRVSSKMMISE